MKEVQAETVEVISIEKKHLSAFLKKSISIIMNLNKSTPTCDAVLACIK